MGKYSPRDFFIMYFFYINTNSSDSGSEPMSETSHDISNYAESNDQLRNGLLNDDVTWKTLFFNFTNM